MAAWSACGTGSGQANEQVIFPSLPGDRHPTAGHPLRDLPPHCGVPARQPQRGPDGALPPGPSRSDRHPFPVARYSQDSLCGHHFLHSELLTCVAATACGQYFVSASNEYNMQLLTFGLAIYCLQHRAQAIARASADYQVLSSSIQPSLCRPNAISYQTI